MKDEDFPTEAKIHEYNHNLTEGFIRALPSFNAGCILIGFHNPNNDTTQLNVSAGTSKGNFYRAAGALLESLVIDGRIKNKGEETLVKKMVEVISAITGDEDPQLLSQQFGEDMFKKPN